MGITFRNDKKIPVKFLEIISNREIIKSIHSLTLFPILVKCSLIDICVITLFQKKSNFPVTARDLIFY